MKWVFVGVLLVAIGLSITAQVVRPVDKSHGIVTLIWATDPNPARTEQIALFKAWYRRKYGEKIDVKVDPTNIGLMKVVIQSVAGAGPDLFDVYGGAADLERYVKSGIILDVTDAAKKHGFSADLVWPGIRPVCVYNGRQYSFPDNAYANVMLYNKTMFDKAHLAYPTGNWTWNQFLKIGQKLSDRRRNGLRQFALLNVDPLEMTYQNGSKMFSAQGTHCIINNARAVQALQFYDNLSWKEHIIPSSAELASQAATGGWGSGNLTLFSNGYFACTEGARWWMVLYRTDTMAALAKGQPAPYRIGVAPMPYFSTPYVFGGGRTTGVNRAGKHVKYAVRFLEYLASKDFNQQINRSYDSIAPVMKYCTGPQGIAVGPAPPLGLESANDPVYVSSLKKAHAPEQSPFIPAYRIDELWLEAQGHLVSGEYTPQQTLSTFQTFVNEDIRRNIAADPRLQKLYKVALEQEKGR